MLQEGQPVVYASRSLTDTEKRYSNIERELLGTVTVETDHLPLTSIWKKTIATSNPRLQRLLLRLAQYDVHIEYLRGRKNIIADALSHVGPLAPESQDYVTSLNNVEKIPVHQMTQIAPASNERLEELCEATAKDHQLQLLAKTVHKGWPPMFKDCPCSMQSYWCFSDDVTYEDGILYKGV